MTAGVATWPKDSSARGIKEIVYDEASIQQRVRELACQITEAFRGHDLVVVGILKGAYLFTCDLVRQLKLPLDLDFISMSRYTAVGGAKEVRVIKDLETSIRHKDILIIEDIVDTGLTLHYLAGILRDREPRSLTICSLLDRPVLRLADIPLKYVGFHVDKEFLVGYGLDYRDRYRNLPYIATLEI